MKEKGVKNQMVDNHGIYTSDVELPIANLEGGEPVKTPMTLNEYAEKNALKFFAGFFIVGIINNNGYTLVQAAADDLATHFNQG